MEPVLIDTDAGDDIDDVLAIAFAARRPEIELLGVTTVAYDTRRRAALVRQVLEACGRPEVPVAAGAHFPMRPLDDARRRQWTDERRMNHCPAGAASPATSEEDAVALMARLIEAHPRPVTLVGIGPATNLAMLLCRRPDLAPRIRALALMGGELQLRRAEHNVASDAVAAHHLLDSGVDVFLGTWSVTRQVTMSRDDCTGLRQGGSRLGALLADCCDRWLPLQTSKPGPVMYDLAPLLWRFRPDLFQTERLRVAVELAGTLTYGWTVAVAGPANAAVSVAMDAAEAKRLLMETLLGA